MEIYLIGLAVAVIGGLMMSRVTKLLHLPAVTAYLVAGLLLGPYCIGALCINGIGFSSLEEKALSSALERAADAALCVIEKGVPETANRYNGSTP